MVEKVKVLDAPILRNAQQEDVQNILDFYNVVGGETDFLSFGKGEYPRTYKDMATSIDAMKESQGNCMILMIVQDTIVGIGTIDSSPKPRFRHVGTLGIVIRQSHAGKGMGRTLMNALIEWSKKNNQLKKISLVTRADNHRAIALYEKLGFREEGTFKQDSFDGETYYDSLSMALFL